MKKVSFFIFLSFAENVELHIIYGENCDSKNTQKKTSTNLDAIKLEPQTNLQSDIQSEQEPNDYNEIESIDLSKLRIVDENGSINDFCLMQKNGSKYFVANFLY